MKKINRVSAPGKLILSGEHAVVYGYPAIAAAVNRRLVADKSGKIESDIPIGAGMGSSAAFAVATSALKVGTLDLEKINTLAYNMEKKLHGNPSGIDNTVVTYGGFLWYRKESDSLKLFRQILPKVKLPRLYLFNSGKPVESTKEMVEHVARVYKKRKMYAVDICRNIETLTKEILKFLIGDANPDFGKLIQENERLLEKLGVVSESTKKMIRKIEKIGGFAKISGAGGKKEGSGMVLIYHKDVEKLILLVKKNNLNLLPAKLGEEGVRIE